MPPGPNSPHAGYPPRKKGPPMLSNVEVKQAGKPLEWVGAAEYIQVQIGNTTYTISEDPKTGALVVAGFGFRDARPEITVQRTGHVHVH
jgi:hypothetical protein